MKSSVKTVLYTLFFATVLQANATCCTSIADLFSASKEVIASAGKRLDTLELSTKNSLGRNLSDAAILAAIVGSYIYTLQKYNTLTESKRDIADIGMAYLFYSKKISILAAALIAAKLGYKNWKVPTLGYEIPASQNKSDARDEIMKTVDIKKTIINVLSTINTMVSTVNYYYFGTSLEKNNFNVIKATMPYGYLTFVINCIIRQLSSI